MSLQFPNSMDECVYFTSRDLKDDSGEPVGEATAWVFRVKCPKCKKALMGKPLDEKTGRPKIRAKEYVCPECGYTEEKTEHEEKLQANVQYVCPHCKAEGEKQVPFKRKSVKGVKTLRVTCDSCNGNIDITKKMKAIKK